MTGHRFDVGIDIGGTYTDLVAIGEHGHRTLVKTPTTPADQSIGFVDALEQAAAANELTLREFLGNVNRICHGTTVTTNAVIERTGAKVGMLTTKGVRDTIEVRRGMRELEYLYDYTYPQPRPLCPRNLRRPIGERIQADGAVLTPLNETDVRVALERFAAEDVAAIAICFLWSLRNPEHELRAAEICREVYPDAYLSLSHQISPTLGEYLRFQTTTVNAYIGPIISTYMSRIEVKLREAGYEGALLIVSSSGGVMSPQAIVTKAAGTLTSGPASGPVAGIWLGNEYGIDNLITIDMGGTSFDAALVKNKEISVRSEQTVAGVYHVGLPSVDVHAIGAGGGTIAWLDQAGGLHVGPQSAGAAPGPACYLNGGTEPTVTDANLVLGRLNPASAIAGGIQLGVEASRDAIGRIAEPKGMSIEAMARAIITLTMVNMADAIGVISVRRGENPKDYTLMAGGGAGAGHAVELAKMMNIDTVLIPRESGMLCALGCLISDIRHDQVSSVETPTDQLDWQRINDMYRQMLASAKAMLDAEKVAPAERQHSLSAEMKYVSQYQQIDVPWPQVNGQAYSEKDLETIKARFHERHETLYAHHDETEPTFVANLKLTAVGKVASVKTQQWPSDANAAGEYRRGSRQVWFEESGFTDTGICDGDVIPAGAQVAGPCIIEQKTTTVVVPPGWSLQVTQLGDFLIEASKT